MSHSLSRLSSYRLSAMKLYVLCILLLFYLSAVFASLSSSVDDTLHEYEDECAKQVNVDLTIVERARKPRRIPENGELDAFAVCMLKKFNIMNKDGSVNLNSHTYKIFSDNVYIHQISDQCKMHGGQNVGETARKIMNCFLKSNELVLALIPRKNNETIIK